MHKLSLKNQTFILHPLKGAFWKEQNMLLISDVHLGKVSHFRKNGSPASTHSISENYERINELIECFNPEELTILGDLFHSEMNNEWSQFESWVEQAGIKINLITGNHDVIEVKEYKKLNISCFESLMIDDFILSHHPQESDLFNLCGHIHPAIKFRVSRTHKPVWLSCFFLKPNQMIFPSFGNFTGSHVLKPNDEDTVFGILENTVRKVKF